jgi:hypothetical protein
MNNKARIQRKKTDIFNQASFYQYLKEMLSMNIDDVIRVASEALKIWLESLSLEEIDRFAERDLSGVKIEFSKYKEEKKRRLFMVFAFDDLLMYSELDFTHPRDSIQG